MSDVQKSDTCGFEDVKLVQDVVKWLYEHRSQVDDSVQQANAAVALIDESALVDMAALSEPVAF